MTQTPERFDESGPRKIVFEGEITIKQIEVVGEMMRVEYEHSLDTEDLLHIIAVDKRGWLALKKILKGGIKRYKKY